MKTYEVDVTYKLDDNVIVNMEDNLTEDEDIRLEVLDVLEDLGYEPYELQINSYKPYTPTKELA